MCWTLKRVFSLPVAPHLVFKGGTSLSKVFGVIDRFSEDIDLSIHREYLGFVGDADPECATGMKRRREAVTRLQADCVSWVHDTFLPSLAHAFAELLGESGGWHVALDPVDPQSLLFTYAKGLSSGALLEYIRPVVKIEIGARSEFDRMLSELQQLEGLINREENS